MSTAATAASPAPSASSSKRPAPAASGSTPSAKRARTAPSADDDDDDDDIKNEDENTPQKDQSEMTEEERAKQARREARTIRNRESAQRSRNQRKAHLAWLESRVVELEAENRALRAGTTAPSTPNKTRESSPANSIASLASDLGLPAEIVTAGGGVNLAAVAPPSADVLEDIKPMVDATPATPTPLQQLPQTPVSMPPPMPANPADMHAENAALRWRVNMLENIVKQAANFFSSYPTGNNAPVPSHMYPQTPFTQPQPAPGMELTLSPPLYPREAVASPLASKTQLPTHPQTSISADAGSSIIDLGGDPVGSLLREARRGPAAGEGLFDRNQLGLAGQPEAVVSGGAGDCGAGQAQGLDLRLDAPFVENAAQAAAPQAGSAPQADNWFNAEGAQAAEWDQEMNDLLETLEGHNKPEGVAPVVPGGPAVGTDSIVVGNNEWTWEAALVDI